jgi:hypothetical protein
MSNEKQQTAVEMFIEQLEEKGYASQETEGVNTINISIDVNDYLALKKQAKEMEKQQTLDFTRNAVRKILDEDRQNPFNLEQSYNETYGGNK